MKILVSYHKDCGRNGHVDGMFVCDKEELGKLYNRKIYFGEILGKHSDVRLDFTEDDFVIHTDDQEFITKLTGYVGGQHISGYNPLHFLPEDEE